MVGKENQKMKPPTIALRRNDMCKMAAIILLVYASSSYALDDNKAPYSDLLTMDETRIVQLCKAAIAKQKPKIDQSDLQLYKIACIHHVKGEKAPFQDELRVRFVLQSTIKIEKGRGKSSNSWQISYRVVNVSLAPGGDAEKSVVEASGVSGFAANNPDE